MSDEREKGVQINVNETVIRRFKEANIQMDLMGSVMIILYALFEDKLELLDCADDSNKQRRMLILYRQLERRGFLEANTKGKSIYKLAPMGNEFVTFLREQYGETVHAEAFKAIAKPIIAEPEEEEIVVGGWITQFVNLFPAGKVAGKVLRTHPEALITKMKAFIKKFGYDKDTILKATQLYLAEQEVAEEGHKYTRTANYFISKDKGQEYVSDLATWCKKVLDGEEAPPGYNTSIMDIG